MSEGVRKKSYRVRRVSDGIWKMSDGVKKLSDGVRRVSNGVRKGSDEVTKGSDEVRWCQERVLKVSNSDVRCQVVSWQLQTVADYEDTCRQLKTIPDMFVPVS